MKFVIIDDQLGSSKQKVELLNKDIDSGSHVFLLIYLTGCPPCNMTKPEWDMLEKEFPDNDNLVVARINSDLLRELKNYGGSPKGYPTMRYICKKGSKITIEEYDGERTKDAFIKWIKSHIGKAQHVGGSRRRKKMASRHSRRHSRKSKSRRRRHSRKSKSKRHSIRHSRKSKRHRRIDRGIKEDIENFRKKRPELFKEFESKLPNDIPPEIELNFKDEV